MVEYIENTDTQYIDTGYTPNGEPIKPYTMPVYGCRWCDGEELIKEYKPCKNADGVEGMYDVMNGEFMDNDSFMRMMWEHYMRSDSIRVSCGADMRERKD